MDFIVLLHCNCYSKQFLSDLSTCQAAGFKQIPTQTLTNQPVAQAVIFVQSQINLF